jgi:hypothetical protein
MTANNRCWVKAPANAFLQTQRNICRHIFVVKGRPVLRCFNSKAPIRSGCPVAAEVAVVKLRILMAERLKASYSNFTIFFTSGYTDDALGYLGRFNSGVGSLSKPDTPATLMRQEREMLDAPSA